MQLNNNQVMTNRFPPNSPDKSSQPVPRIVIGSPDRNSNEDQQQITQVQVNSSSRFQRQGKVGANTGSGRPPSESSEGFTSDRQKETSFTNQSQDSSGNKAGGMGRTLRGNPSAGHLTQLGESIVNQILPTSAHHSPAREQQVQKGIPPHTKNIVVDEYLDKWTGGFSNKGGRPPPVPRPGSTNVSPNPKAVANSRENIDLESQKYHRIKHGFALLAGLFKTHNLKYKNIILSSFRAASRRTTGVESPEGGSSSGRLPRLSRNRLTPDMPRQKSVRSMPTQSQAAQFQKLMVLSDEAKNAIKQMQRFDRFYFLVRSEQILKDPIYNQVARFERIKGSHKQMWNYTYDNELTVTCLANHMKYIFQVLRELKEVKVQKNQQQQKLEQLHIEYTSFKNKQSKGQGSSGGSNQDSGMIEYQKTVEALLEALLKQTYWDSRKHIETKLKLANGTHKKLYEAALVVINDVIQLNEQPKQVEQLQKLVLKLFEEQNDETRTIQTLERLKRNHEKAAKDAKTTTIQTNNEFLVNICDLLIDLHTRLRGLSGQGTNRSQMADNTEKLKQDLQNQRIKIKDLEAKIATLTRQKKALEDMRDLTVITTWQTELTTILTKIQNLEPYHNDISKQRRLMASRKDNKFNGVITSNLTLLEHLLRKQKEIEQLKRSAVDKVPVVNPSKILEDKFNKQKQRADELEATLTRINRQFEDYKKKEKLSEKDTQPLQIQLNQLFKICTLIQAAFEKRQAEVSTVPANTVSGFILQLQKIRKNVENRKRMSPSLTQILNLIEVFIKHLLDVDTAQRKRVQQEQNFELMRTRQLKAIDTMTNNLMRHIEPDNVKIDEALLKKIKPVLETNLGKAQKGADTQVSDLYDMYKNVVLTHQRLYTMLEIMIKTVKEQGSQKINQTNAETNQKISQLERQLQIQKSKLGQKETQMGKLREQDEKRIQQLQKQLQVEKTRYSTRDQEAGTLRAEIKARQGDIEALRSQLANKQEELKRLRNQKNKRSPQVERQLKQQQDTITRYVETERNLNGKIGELDTELKRQNTQHNRAVADLNRQISELNKKINQLNRMNSDYERQLANSGRQATKLNHITQQLEEANKQIRSLQDQLAESNRTVTDYKRKEDNQARASQRQQPVIQKLRHQKDNLQKELSELNRRFRELSERETHFKDQISQLNREIQNRQLDMKSAIDQAEREKRQISRVKDDALRQLEDSKRNIQNYKEDLRLAQSNISNSTQSSRVQISKIRQEQNKKRDELVREYKLKLDEAERIKQSMLDSQRTSSDLQGEFNKLKQQLQRSQQDLQRAQQQLQRAQPDLQKTQQELRTSQQDLQRAQQQLQRVQQQLQRTQQDLSKSQQELRTSQQDLQRAQLQLKNSKEELQRLQNDRSRSGSEVGQLRNTIVILEQKITSFGNLDSQVKYLEQANKSLKDQNDVLRAELLSRGKSVKMDSSSSTNAAEVSRLQSELTRLQQDHSRLKGQHDKLLGTQQTSQKDQQKIFQLTNEVNNLKNAIDSNEGVFHQMVRDNQMLINDVNVLKARQSELLLIINKFQAGSGKADQSVINAIKSEASITQQRLEQEIRTLRSDKQRIQRDLSDLRTSQRNAGSDRQALQNQKAEAERQLTIRNNQVNQLKAKISKLTVDTSQLLNSQNEISRLGKQLRQTQIKEQEARRDLSTKQFQLQQTEIKVNSLTNEISTLRQQVESKIMQPVVDTSRELQEARLTITKLQTERNTFEQLFQQKKRDYQEIENRSRTQLIRSQKYEQLERKNELLERSVSELQAQNRKLQTALLARGTNQLGSASQLVSPNSRFMQVMEEKRALQLQNAKFKALLDRQIDTKRQIEQKFRTMLEEKTKFTEKIDVLTKTINNKQYQLLRNYQLREDSIKELIEENKKIQKELRAVNQKLSIQHKVSTKALEESLFKLEAQLSKLRRQNVHLKDQIEDLEDELVDRSRNKTPNRTHIRKQDDEGKYMLRVEGDQLQDEIYYLENKIKMLEDASVHSVRSGGEYPRRNSSRNHQYADDRMMIQNQRLMEKVRFLQKQRHLLHQRVKVLSVFCRIETPNHAFIQNLNMVMDNILAFLNQSEQFADSIITYGNFIPDIIDCISEEDYKRYFWSVEKFIKDLFMRTSEAKNQILAQQASQLVHFKDQMSELVNQQIEYIEEEERATPKSSYSRRHDFQRIERGQTDTTGMASFIALQHLFRLYVRARSPDVLEEIAHLLNVNDINSPDGQ